MVIKVNKDILVYINILSLYINYVSRSCRRTENVYILHRFA